MVLRRSVQWNPFRELPLLRGAVSELGAHCSARDAASGPDSNAAASDRVSPARSPRHCKTKYVVRRSYCIPHDASPCASVEGVVARRWVAGMGSAHRSRTWCHWGTRAKHLPAVVIRRCSNPATPQCRGHWTPRDVLRLQRCRCSWSARAGRASMSWQLRFMSGAPGVPSHSRLSPAPRSPSSVLKKRGALRPPRRCLHTVRVVANNAGGDPILRRGRRVGAGGASHVAACSRCTPVRSTRPKRTSGARCPRDRRNRRRY